MDHTPFSDSQPRPEPEKAFQTSSTTLDLQDGIAQTFIVDLASLGGRVHGESEKEDRKSTPTGEHQLDSLGNSSLSLHEVLEKTPLPPLSVDVPPAILPPSTDTESVGTPIQPPGLPLPVDEATVKPPSETVVPVSPVEDRDTERATPSSFSLSGLKHLCTLIPKDLLPDDLLVFDPDNISHLETNMRGSQRDKPVRYVRIFPEPKAPQVPTSTSDSTEAEGSPAGDRDRPVRVARLYLKESNVLGGGHHSSVYSAPLRLKLSADSDEESTVRVGVKTAFARCGAHEMLRREAVAYNAFPRYLMEDKYPPAKPPQPPTAFVQTESAPPEGAAQAPEAETRDSDASGAEDSAPAPVSESTTLKESDRDDMSTDGGDKCSTHTSPLEPAVVPKFFGYYAAVDADGKAIDHDDAHPSCDKDDTCAVSWPTRLLLLEECGTPVVFRKLTPDQRMACYRLLRRLHKAGFTQGSVYERNVLVQPGPLSAPPEERSGDTPSFRIIDFGRMKRRADFSSSGRFANECSEEKEWAYETIVDAYE